MSVADILAELPKLKPEELEAVLERTLQLHRGAVLEASPELLKAIEEADAEPLENYVDIDEAQRIIESWSSESSSPPKQ